MALSAVSGAAPVRTVIVRVIIGSFSLAALLGIVALLRGGEFGPTQTRVLLTTLLVGVVSIAALCYLATAGRRSQPVGVAGGAIVLVPFATALLMIWGNVEDRPSEGLLKAFAIGAIVAATLAQACVLLVLAERGRTGVRRILLTTLVLAGALAVMTSSLVLGYTPSESGYFFRVLGVVAILDVLGTVVVAALMKFGAGDVAAAPARAADPTLGGIRLPADLAEGVSDLAARSGQSREEVVAAAVRDYLRQRAE
jgi:F0F1-type ATP synthase assembly protein I